MQNAYSMQNYSFHSISASSYGVKMLSSVCFFMFRNAGCINMHKLNAWI